jgi:redox-regulated HSP33 family molecular chaperone
VTSRVLLVRILLAAGLVLLAGGLLIGFLPRSAADVSCGSAFHGNGDALGADFGRAAAADSAGVRLGSVTAISDRCSDARSATRIPAIVLLVLGGAAAAAGLTAAAGKTAAEDQTPGVS